MDENLQDVYTSDLLFHVEVYDPHNNYLRSYLREEGDIVNFILKEHPKSNVRTTMHPGFRIRCKVYLPTKEITPEEQEDFFLTGKSNVFVLHEIHKGVYLDYIEDVKYPFK